MWRRRLIVFTRFPEAGKVKTRLLDSLTEKETAAVHKRMTERTLHWAEACFPKKQTDIEVCYEGGDKKRMKDWLGSKYDYASQGPGDLGERMGGAFERNFALGIESVVLIGTDIPQLTAFHVRMAFKALKKHDVVIAPVQDGGYCLIGMKQRFPELFKSINWGTRSVFTETLKRAKNRNLSVHVLEPLQDVDKSEDLVLWERVENQHLSIVIPTLNEEKTILRVLDQLKDMKKGEVIVADGGSHDSTVELAKRWGAQVCRSNEGRGSQLNAGASKASGDIFLFLHADTQLPQGFAGHIRRLLLTPEIIGGAFLVKLWPSSPLLTWIEKTINWRTKIFKLPYGDQAFFVRASVFRQMRGFAEIPLMEDVEFIRRLKKCGKMALISDPVITSSRLFLQRGILRTTLKNKIIFFGYILGVPPERLARTYRKRD